MSKAWSTSTLVAGAAAVASQPDSFLADKTDAELEAELAAACCVNETQRVPGMCFLNNPPANKLLGKKENTIWGVRRSFCWNRTSLVFLNPHIIDQATWLCWLILPIWLI